jgi:hypothetical protein
MLKKEEKITDAVIENMMSWHHSGFHVHIGERIWPEDEKGLEMPGRDEDHRLHHRQTPAYEQTVHRQGVAHEGIENRNWGNQGKTD